jgi:hypothetical protein
VPRRSMKSALASQAGATRDHIACSWSRLGRDDAGADEMGDIDCSSEIFITFNMY